MGTGSKFKKVLVIAAAIALPAFAAANVGQAAPLHKAAAKTQIKFKFAAGTSARYVLIIGPSGVIKKTITAGTETAPITLDTTMQGTKKVNGAQKPDGVYKVSLHMLDAQGKYIGPVMFKTSAKQGSKNKWSTTVLPTPKGVTNLGTITQQSASYAKSSLTLGSGKYGKFTAVSSLTSGKPIGAGTLGLKAASSSPSSSSLRDQAVVCDSFDQSLGGDCDLDGVVNAIDPDDDNDAILDLADKSTSGFEAQQFLPWSTLYLDLGGSDTTKTLNANIGSVTLADIEKSIGATNSNFSTNFYISLPGEDMNNYDAAWIDCGALSYCDADSGSATTGPPSGNATRVWNHFWCPEGQVNSGGGCDVAQRWRDYTGTVIGNDSDENDTTHNYAVDDYNNDGISNGLTLMSNNGYSVWAGGMRPAISDLGTGILDEFQFGDPYVLKLRNKTTGEVKGVPMSLGAFFVTVPAISSANGTPIDYSAGTPLGTQANPIQVASDGTFDLSFWRPQRQAIEGVDESFDPALPFMDLGGLRYGLVLNTNVDYKPSALVGERDGAEVGCSSRENRNIYSGMSSSLNRTPDESTEHPEYDKNLWPLTDTARDGVVDAGSVISFTFNIKNCITYLESRASHAGSGWSNYATLNLSHGYKIPIQLTAVGIDLTGGASRAAQSFWIELPAGASGW